MNQPIARNVEEYIARQRAAIAANPECGISRYNLAVALIGQKKFEEAEKELQAAVMNSPNLAEAYVQLGGICLTRGDLEGCLAYNRQSVNARAGFAEGYGNIGFVLLQQGNVEEAIRNLEKATRWNPRFVQAFATLANAYLMNGEIEKSIETGHAALQIFPDFAIAHHNLSIAYLENEQPETALEHHEKAVALGYEVPEEIRNLFAEMKAES